jgi:hypothetical protein
MKLELVFPDKVNPVRGYRGYFRFAGKGVALGQLVAGRHLYKKILYTVPFEGFEELEIIG